MSQQKTARDEKQLIKVRREKLNELKELGLNPYQKVKYEVSIHTKDIKDNFDELEGSEVSVAGRLMSKRVMGKASFANVSDASGNIQLYLKRDDMGTDKYKRFKRTDIGDIVGLKGKVFRTQKGEMSIMVEEMETLSKSMLPLPEKFHGLVDTDTRYRQRYLDLIMNPDVATVFRTRSQIMSIIRRVMDNRGYLEVETPILSNHSTNSAAKPFITHHNTLDMGMYLRVETELALKRLIVGGMEKVYEIGRIFRNEGMDKTHNPEFTTIEMYEAYTDYYGMMALTEELFQTIAMEVQGKTKITYQGVDLDLSAPWPRLTMIESIKKYSGIDFEEIQTDEAAIQTAKDHHLEIAENATRGNIINLFFEEKVEEHLIQPTIIYEYPIEISPLAKRTPHDPRLTERFEFFMGGFEYGNAFTELNDPDDQRERFVEQAKLKHGEDDYSIDEDFVTALEYGMPPTGGMGIGIDRIVMLFTDSASIRDVLFFPTMRPKS